MRKMPIFKVVCFLLFRNKWHRSGYSFIWLLENKMMRCWPFFSKDRITSLILSVAAKGVLSSFLNYVDFRLLRLFVPSRLTRFRDYPPYPPLRLGALLAFAINNSISTSAFPNSAKIASVVPIDKKTDNKYVISNFRPVSILNYFSKVYENVIKNELLKSMNVHLSPFISAYRKNCNTQHVLLMLLKEWREHLDNNKTVGGILMDLSEAFDCVPNHLLFAKVAANVLMIT